VDSEDVVAAWLASPKHRENIMNTRYEEIGIGTARGMYQGKDTVFIVQLFGAPRAVPQAPQVAAAMEEPAVPQVLPPPAVPSPAPVPQPAVAGAENAVILSDTQQTLNTAVREGEKVVEKTAKKYSTFTERIAANPRTVTSVFYLTLATLVLLALTFVFFLRMAVPHPHMLIHSVAFLAIIGSVLLLNYYISTASARVF
jgi:hypothetical protein